MNKLKLSAAGLILIALAEGYRQDAYHDVAGILTNGFGNTHNVTKTVSVPQALKTLERNTTEAGQAVNQCITRPMSQNTYDAFVSLTFNIGTGAFCKSTLVRKYNSGDPDACKEILRWNRAGGMVVQGLVTRRQQEYELCKS
jgi:lysozyme